MAWKGIDDYNIFWAVNPALEGWTEQQRIDVGTSARPALVEFRHKVILVWKGVPGDSGIYWSKFDGKGSWQAPSGGSVQQQIAGRGSSHGPALVVYRDQLHMFWKGVDDDLKVYHAVLVDPVNNIWGPQEVVMFVDAGNLATGQTPVPIGTSDTPAATIRGDELLLAWKGVPGDHALWFSRYVDGSFSRQVAIPNVGSETGPAIASFGGPLVIAWRGINEDHTLYVTTPGPI